MFVLLFPFLLCLSRNGNGQTIGGALVKKEKHRRWVVAMKVMISILLVSPRKVLQGFSPPPVGKYFTVALCRLEHISF